MPSRADINEQRANLILDTPEGRSAMAQVMVEPIRRARYYQGIDRRLLMVDRRLLMVDELPQGAYARYENEIRTGTEEERDIQWEKALCGWLVFYSDYKEDVMVEGITKERFTNAIDQLEV